MIIDADFSKFTPLLDSLDTGIPGVTYSDFVKTLFRPLPQASMFTHAVLGLVTEHHEAHIAKSEVNFVEECGDYLFFMVAALQQLPHTPNFTADRLADLARMECEAAANCLPYDDSELNHADVIQHVLTPCLDMAKRWLAYDKPPSPEQCNEFAARIVYGFALLHGNEMELADLEQTGKSLLERLVQVNVAKLKHRYQSGFSTASAVNRDLAGEVAAMQGA